MIERRRLDWLLPSWLEDADAYDQSINEDMVTIYYTIAVNLIIFAACILFFSSYRRYNDKIYAPKADFMPTRTPPKMSSDTWFGWIKELYNIDDDVIICKGGYDILFFIRFYRIAFKIFIFFSIYAWGILLPINSTGHGDAGGNTFQLWSMTNIQQGSSRCWYHLIGIYLLTTITIYFLEKEFVIYAKHRHDYLRQRHAHLRTVLVEGIPHKMRSTVTLATYFETLYPNSVASVKIGQDLRHLDRLVAQRIATVGKLERYLYANHNSNKRPSVSVGNMLEDVDAIRYYTQLVDDLNEAVEKEQQTSQKLAKSVDTNSNGNAIEIIESFLKVTKIGSIKRLLKQKSSSSNKWFNATTASSGSGNNSPKERPLQQQEEVAPKKEQVVFARMDTSKFSNISSYQNDDDYDDEDTRLMSKESKFSSANPPFEVYSMTWSEWFFAMRTAPSGWDCLRILREGRLSEYHHQSPISRSHNDSTDEEDAFLISPPEERRMFLSKAFVTFKTFTAATIARQVVHMQLVGHLAVSEAPEPSDMTWVNYYGTRNKTFWKQFIVEVLVTLLIVVWVAPVTLLSYVTSENAIRSYIPLIDRMCTNSVWYQSFVQLLQPGALVALMNIIPPLLTGLGIFEGCISFSVNQFKAFDRYFTFQIINVFLVTTIAGSVIDCVKDIYSDPESTFYLLGNSLPKMGAYFTNYLLMKAFTGLGMEIIRLPACLSASLKYLFTSNVTPRDRNEQMLFGSIRSMANPGWFPYAKIYAQDILLVVVCCTYACIAPLILVAGLCYFAGASYIYKHQMLYVYEPIFETGGKWWPRMARCFVVALLFAQATMVGMMILKESYTQIYFLVLIIVFTTGYYWYINALYVPLAAQLPFDMAVAMDLDTDCDDKELMDGLDEYIQPSLRAGIVSPNVEFPITKTEPMTV